ncbi:hypothetical protein scyTo_0022910, partial [Scyliorhinus torazame]|nr:hypothetical protein [Scyliorhinus torazame]
MAAYFAGFSRLVSVAAGTLTGRQGMTLWYGLLGVRLVALFVADRPWATLRSDFICNETVEPYCWASCFNMHFDFPMDVLWDFSYVLTILPIFCLYQLAPGAWGPKAAAPEEPPGRLTLDEAGAKPKASRRRPWAAVASALSLAVIEGAFLWVLARIQLPLVVPTLVLCRSPACPHELECGLYAQAEKLGALAVLAFASGLNILVSLVYIGTACLAERWRRV